MDATLTSIVPDQRRARALAEHYAAAVEQGETRMLWVLDRDREAVLSSLSLGLTSRVYSFPPSQVPVPGSSSGAELRNADGSNAEPFN